MMRMANVVTAVAVLASVRSVHAEETSSSERARQRQARVLLREGRAKFDLGKFDDAIVLFERAYELWPYAEALYNLGQCWRSKNDPRRALEKFRVYLQNDPDPANKREVEERIRELEEIVAQDERVRQKTEESSAKPPTGAVELAIPEVPEPPAPEALDAVVPPVVAEARPPWYREPWAWGLVGGGVVSVGVGVWYLGASEDTLARAHRTSSPAAQRQLLANYSTERDVGVWATLGGAALLLGGAGWLGWRFYQGRDGGPTLVVGAGYLGAAGEF